MTPRDFQIHRHQSALMQSILRVVQQGARWWTAGTVTPLKVLAFTQKMHEQFGVLDSPMKRSRRKAAGGANVRLFLHPTHNATRFNFWLVSTSALENQKMQDAWNTEVHQRLKFEHKYVLTQIPKPKDGVTWTWKMQSGYFRDWEARMVDLARRDRVNEITDTIQKLKAVPRWSGIRSQVIRIMGKSRSIWVAEHKHQPKLCEAVHFPGPAALKPIQFMDAFDDPPMTLGIWLDAYQARLTQLDLGGGEVDSMDKAEREIR